MTNALNSRPRAGPFPLKRILVLNDLSDAAENAAWRAGLLAQQHGAWLRILHVSAWHDPASHAEGLLKELAWRLQEHLRIAVVAQSLRGGLRRELVAAGQDADLLVTGVVPRPWRRGWVTGIHPDTLVQRCGLPILVVRRAANVPYQRVVAGVQPGPQAVACVAAASGMAGGPHLELLPELRASGELLPAAASRTEMRARRVEGRIHAVAQAMAGARMKEAPCVVLTQSVDTLLETERTLFPDLVVVARPAGKPLALAPALPRRLLAHTRTDTLILPEPSRSSLHDWAHGALARRAERVLAG